MSDVNRLRAVVRGRVQGVGFRYFVRRLAIELNLRGFVRNRADGTLEVLASGPKAVLDRLLEGLGSGPAGARVSDVDAHFDSGPVPGSGFEITG